MSRIEHTAAAPSERVRRLRAAIESGTYAPSAEKVAESLLGWLVPPDRFDGQRSAPESADAAIEDQGPLPGDPSAPHTAESQSSKPEECMEIVVHGRNVEVDPDVEAASRRKIERLPRLASDIRRVELEFSEIKNPRVADDQCCEMVVHLTKNFVKAHAVAADPRTALDRVVDKAEHQLSKVHGKRVTRRQH